MIKKCTSAFSKLASCMYVYVCVCNESECVFAGSTRSNILLNSFASLSRARRAWHGEKLFVEGVLVDDSFDVLRSPESNKASGGGRELKPPIFRQKPDSHTHDRLHGLELVTELGVAYV